MITRLPEALIAPLALVAIASAQTSTTPPKESDYIAVDYLVPPDGTRIEVGGMDFLPNGRLVVSTRRGQVWLIDNPLAKDPRQAHFKLFAEGLQEGLGLAVIDGQIYVLQRSELSHLGDADGDDRCDSIQTISNAWGVSGHYHEFAFGLPHDAQKNFYISLNVSFGDPQWWHGRSTVPDRGWIMKIGPGGVTTPFACGFRSPCGLGMNSAGDLFETDNQGDWMPACPIFHVKEGRFYGHPASLNWTDEYKSAGRTASDTIPPERQREPAAIWIPYDWSRSTGSLIEDQTGGKFGPFDGQMFVAEMTSGNVLRAQLEKVRGEYQGAVWLFRQHVGSAVRVAFAPDGTLFAGFTDRGWGGQSPPDGIGRLRPTGRTPMEVRTVHLLQDGFELEFTLPLAANATLGRSSVRATQYDYDYWWEYGSPTRRERTLIVTGVELSVDRRKAVVRFADLRAAQVARVGLSGVIGEGGEPLLHEEFAYTVNQLPEGPLTTELVAKLVPPPAARENNDEGTLELTLGDALDAWKTEMALFDNTKYPVDPSSRAEGWRVQLAEMKLDPANPAKFAPPDPPAAAGASKDAKEGDEPPQAILINDASEHPSELVSRYQFGDVDVHVDFMLPKGGNSGLYLMGRYEVQMIDSSDAKELHFGDCGGIYQGWGDANKWPGRAPLFNAFRGPGRWHSLTVSFRAPRFDVDGKKIANARFVRVMINDTLLHENVDVDNPTRGAFEGPEVPFGPLRFQGDHGPVAFRNIYVRPRGAREEEPGWVSLLDAVPEASLPPGWTLENGVRVARAPMRWLTERRDYSNVELRAEVKISGGGFGELLLRADVAPDGSAGGYRAAINSTLETLPRTGSIGTSDLERSDVASELVPPDTWFELRVTCRDEPDGTRLTTRVNGVVVREVTASFHRTLTTYINGVRRESVEDKNPRPSGSLGLEFVHLGSVLHVRKLEVRELK